MYRARAPVCEPLARARYMIPLWNRTGMYYNCARPKNPTSREKKNFHGEVGFSHRKFMYRARAPDGEPLARPRYMIPRWNRSGMYYNISRPIFEVSVEKKIFTGGGQNFIRPNGHNFGYKANRGTMLGSLERYSKCLKGLILTLAL
jgi:hypothetical protein